MYYPRTPSCKKFVSIKEIVLKGSVKLSAGKSEEEVSSFEIVTEPSEVLIN
jgi:hypothetical protein